MESMSLCQIEKRIEFLYACFLSKKSVKYVHLNESILHPRKMFVKFLRLFAWMLFVAPQHLPLVVPPLFQNFSSQKG